MTPRAAVLQPARLEDLLLKTSRTFALSIPLLPEPPRAVVGLAYLLFRIADTFEDAVTWPRARRVQALGELGELLERPEGAEARARGWLAAPAPIEHAGYQELLAAAPQVIDTYAALPHGPRQALRHHLGRTVSGMATFVERADAAGRLALSSLQDLRDYCYVVAGIVGELLTDLFLLEVSGLDRIAGFLRARARAFGEGLQLVNILKDAAGDASEGRTYLPGGVPRAEVFALALRDLHAAAEYSNQLQAAGAPRGLVAFTALPVLLARASLALVEAHGPGSKMPRDQVMATVAGMELRLDRGEPAVP